MIVFILRLENDLWINCPKSNDYHPRNMHVQIPAKEKGKGLYAVLEIGPYAPV